MNLEVANKLLKLRKQNGLSQEELAEKLGVSRQAVSKWERGEASPDTDNLIQLSNLYRVSLDELLDIDVKTFKNPSYPRSSSDMNAQTIRLTKYDNDDEGLNYMFSESSSKRVVYPKNSLDEEIYPNGVQPPPVSQPYIQSNPIVTTKTPDNKKNSSKHQRSNRKNKKSYVPPYTSNRFINALERFMAKHNISYKGLYTFPIYAIGIVLAVICTEFWHGEYLAVASILGIPLYYTLIKAIKRRNPNFFGYPILALILMLLGVFLGFDELSLLWLATIPFYYWFFNKK